MSKNRKVMLLANRVGEINGETGGGSIFRKKLNDFLLAKNYEVETVSVASPCLDSMETIRGPLLTASWNNLLFLIRTISQQDLVIISGSWSFLLLFTSFICLLCGIPCLTFLTMNSTAAVNACFKGWLWAIARVLYFLTDFCNCILSVGTYTRSEEYLRELRSTGYSVQGAVFFNDQYDAFAEIDSADAVWEARHFLSGGRTASPLLLYCGRVTHGKRIPLLIQNKPDDVVLAIVGYGPLSPEIRAFHSPEKGIICHVDKMVPQSLLRTYYRAADVHVSASDFETLGNTVHEALLCGCPVVVQRAGGYISQVAHGDNGYLVDWTSPAEVSAAVSDVLKGEIKEENVKPLERDVFDPVFLVSKYISEKRSMRERLVAVMFIPLLMCVGVLARVYECCVVMAP